MSNVFQTNMVLQREKPIHVWGWAKPGEEVSVSFAGEQASATAGKDRAWKVMLPAVPANSKPQRMTVKGKDQTLVLDNILVFEHPLVHRLPDVQVGFGVLVVIKTLVSWRLV